MANVISKESGLKRTTLSKHLKDSIYLIHDKCAICVLKHNGFRTNFEIDHIVPLSKGGSDKDVNNFQILCKECNRKKGNKIEQKVDIVPVVNKTLLVEENSLNELDGLHRPLPKDPYYAFISFYVAFCDTKFRPEEVVWFNMPLSYVQEFMKEYKLDKQTLIDFMQKEDFYPLCEEERYIKETTIRMAQVNTIKRQSDNLMAVAMLRNIDKEKKEKNNTVINIQINQNVLNNLIEEYGNE